MNKIINAVFYNKSPVFPKLLEYGFTMTNGDCLYQTDIMDGQMRLSVRITPADITTEVYDYAAESPYTLFLVQDAVGSFVGAVRTEYETVLKDIAEKCFQTEVFKSAAMKQIIAYLRTQHQVELEFLWEKFTDNAICRRKDNQKWYGVFCKIAKRKLGIDSDDPIEVAVIRMATADVPNAIASGKFYPAYHMNKKNWISVILDDYADMAELFSCIENSYLLAAKKK